MNRTFLTAEWRYLAMLNFAMDPAILRPFVPAGTELDSYRGITYASVVGFRFLRTRIFGIGFPFHRDFEEVNLRFYVRRRVAEQWRRGVVFVRELVPRPAIAIRVRQSVLTKASILSGAWVLRAPRRGGKFAGKEAF